MAAPSDKDKVLEDYLGGDSRLSKTYRETSGELPPAELDSRILSEARRSVEPRTPHPAAPFSGRWMLPASLAVVVLAVSVVVLLPDRYSPLDDRPDLQTAPASSALPAEPAAEPAAAPASSGGRIISSEKLEQRKQQPTEAAKKSSPALSEDAPPAGLLYAPEAPEFNAAPSSSPDLAVPRRPQAVERLEGMISDEAQLMEESLRKDRQRESAASEAETTRRLERRTLSAPSVVPSSPELDAARSSPLKLEDAVRADPAAWLEFIRRLIDTGRPEEAASQLEAFKRQFPDHPVPAEILSSLKIRRQ